MLTIFLKLRTCSKKIASTRRMEENFEDEST